MNEYRTVTTTKLLCGGQRIAVERIAHGDTLNKLSVISVFIVNHWSQTQCLNNVFPIALVLLFTFHIVSYLFHLQNHICCFLIHSHLIHLELHDAF